MLRKLILKAIDVFSCVQLKLDHSIILCFKSCLCLTKVTCYLAQHFCTYNVFHLQMFSLHMNLQYVYKIKLWVGFC